MSGKLPLLGGGKTFTLKAYKPLPIVSPEDAVASWEKFRGAIEKIYAQQASQLDRKSVV